MKKSKSIGRLALIALATLNLIALSACATGGDYDRNPASLSQCNDEVSNSIGECREGIGPRAYIDRAGGNRGR